MRIVWVVVLCGLLAGCGIARQREMQARNDALKEQSRIAMEDCNTKLPKGNPKTAIVRAQCVNDALVIMRPIFPYPDLLDLSMAHRLAVAERYQKGQITGPQANEELAQKNSELTAEEQRRLLANRSVGAQESMAAASIMAAGPKTCTRIGNSVNCY